MFHAYSLAVGRKFGCVRVRVLRKPEDAGGPGTPALNGLKAVPFEWFVARNHEPGWPLGRIRSIRPIDLVSIESQKGFSHGKAWIPTLVCTQGGRPQGVVSSDEHDAQPGGLCIAHRPGRVRSLPGASLLTWVMICQAAGLMAIVTDSQSMPAFGSM